MREENATAHIETRRYIEAVLEAFKHEIRLVAEGVGQMRDDLTRAVAALDQKIERTAAETQAMIKFSHAELYNRMRTLEETHSKLEDAISDLQTRVERLEGSTH